MAARPIVLMPSQGVAALERERLLTALLGSIELAAERVWASYFLVGLEALDRRGSVRMVLDALVRASVRHLDVRILVDDFSGGVEHTRPNVVAATYLARRGVNVRVYMNKTRRTSHSKFLLCDAHEALIGSANLTPGGLDHNRELTLAVRSADVTRYLAERFELGWAEGTPWPSA